MTKLAPNPPCGFYTNTALLCLVFHPTRFLRLLYLAERLLSPRSNPPPFNIGSAGLSAFGSHPLSDRIVEGVVIAADGVRPASKGLAPQGSPFRSIVYCAASVISRFLFSASAQNWLV